MPYILSDDDRDEVLRAQEIIRNVRGATSGANGISVPPTPIPGEPPRLNDLAGRRFKVTAIHGDYLTCRTWDGATQGNADVLVARPWDLQRTPFDGQTVNGVTYTFTSDVERSATDGVTTEVHVVTPPYFVGCEIRAFMHIQSSGLTVGSVTVYWEDINVAGRAWAVKAT